MADLTINDAAERLNSELRQLAPDEHHKLEGEAVSLHPEEQRDRQSPTGGSKLERARAFVARQDGRPLTPELIEEAINTGRP
jgi:hypothetical protein